MPVFKETFSVGAPPEEVWRFLMDVERLGACIPGCQEVQAVDDSTFKAEIKVKVGPFSTTQSAIMRLTELDPPHHLAAEGQGDDPRMGSKVNIKAVLDIEAAGESESRVEYSIDIRVLGRLGMLGDAVMRAKAKETSDQFARNIKSAIEKGWKP